MPSFLCFEIDQIRAALRILILVFDPKIRPYLFCLKHSYMRAKTVDIKMIGRFQVLSR